MSIITQMFACGTGEELKKGKLYKTSTLHTHSPQFTLILPCSPSIFHTSHFKSVKRWTDIMLLVEFKCEAFFPDKPPFFYKGRGRKRQRNIKRVGEWARDWGNEQKRGRECERMKDNMSIIALCCGTIGERVPFSSLEWHLCALHLRTTKPGSKRYTVFGIHTPKMNFGNIKRARKWRTWLADLKITGSFEASMKRFMAELRVFLQASTILLKNLLCTWLMFDQF